MSSSNAFIFNNDDASDEHSNLPLDAAQFIPLNRANELNAADTEHQPLPTGEVNAANNSNVHIDRYIQRFYDVFGGEYAVPFNSSDFGRIQELTHPGLTQQNIENVENLSRFSFGQPSTIDLILSRLICVVCVVVLNISYILMRSQNTLRNRLRNTNEGRLCLTLLGRLSHILGAEEYYNEQNPVHRNQPSMHHQPAHSQRPPQAGFQRQPRRFENGGFIPFENQRFNQSQGGFNQRGFNQRGFNHRDFRMNDGHNTYHN